MQLRRSRHSPPNSGPPSDRARSLAQVMLAILNSQDGLSIADAYDVGDLVLGTVEHMIIRAYDRQKGRIA